MKKEYWFVCAFVEPCHCAKVYTTLVVSEPIEKFIARNANDEFNHFVVISITQIDVRKYNALKKFNPSNESYFRMLNRDYGKIPRGEDDDGLNLELDEDQK